MSKKNDVLSKKSREKEKEVVMKTFEDIAVKTVFVYIQPEKPVRLMVKADEKRAYIIKGVDKENKYVYEPNLITVRFEGKVQKIRAIAKI